MAQEADDEIYMNIYVYIYTYIHTCIHIQADRMAQEADDEIIQQQQRIKAIAESIERLTIASKEDIILQVILFIYTYMQKINASTDILNMYVYMYVHMYINI
jgi:hypothetical protein